LEAEIMTTRILRALALAMACFSGVRPAWAQTNILTNGDFETDPEGTTAGGTDTIDVGVITGWRMFAVGGATGTATVTSAAGRNGKGIELVRSLPDGADSAFDKDDPAVRQTVPAEERIYKLTVDARDGGVHAGTPALRTEMQFNNTAYNRSADFDPGAAFETFGLTVRSDAGGSLSSRFNLPAGGDYSAHLDNATLLDVTSGLNRMVNGGFENSAASLTNWRFFDTTGASGTATINGDARTGARAAALEVTSDPAGGDIGLDIDPFRVATIGGEELTFSFASKALERPTADTRLKASIAGFDATGAYTGEIVTELVNPEGSEYEMFSFDFTVPDEVYAINVGFRVFDELFSINTSGGYLIDDVSVISPVQIADFDGDLDVDGNDFLYIQQHLGGETSASDIEKWKATYGTVLGAPSVGAIAAVPEPAAFALAAMGVIGAGAVRRRRMRVSRRRLLRAVTR
jgi:hypothetical protein